MNLSSKGKCIRLCQRDPIGAGILSLSRCHLKRQHYATCVVSGHFVFFFYIFICLVDMFYIILCTISNKIITIPFFSLLAHSSILSKSSAINCTMLFKILLCFFLDFLSEIIYNYNDNDNNNEFCI